MSTSTQNLNMTIPAAGDTGWDGSMAGNLTTLDTAHGQLAAHSTLNVASMSNPAVPVVDLRNGRIVHIPLSVSATGLTLTNASDGYITFHIVQPSGGNCAFTWPASLKDGGDISSASGTTGGNTISRQTFAWNSQLGCGYAIGPLLTGPK